jgi:hypothetical protein
MDPYRWAKLARYVFSITESDDNKAASLLADDIICLPESSEFRKVFFNQEE